MNGPPFHELDRAGADRITVAIPTERNCWASIMPRGAYPQFNVIGHTPAVKRTPAEFRGRPGTRRTAPSSELHAFSNSPSAFRFSVDAGGLSWNISLYDDMSNGPPPGTVLFPGRRFTTLTRQAPGVASRTFEVANAIAGET